MAQYILKRLKPFHLIGYWLMKKEILSMISAYIPELSISKCSLSFQSHTLNLFEKPIQENGRSADKRLRGPNLIRVWRGS